MHFEGVQLKKSKRKRVRVVEWKVLEYADE
jgi:hypothetical protein